MHKILSQQRKLCHNRVVMLKERRLSQQKYVVATKERRSTRSSSRDKRLHTCNKDLQQRHKTLSRQRRQIWAIIFRDSHIALILGPKLIGLYKYKRLWKARQSVSIKRTRVPGELRTLLYYTVLIFSSFLRRLDLEYECLICLLDLKH